MALLIGKKDIRSVFEKAWTTSYVSGFLQYAERSKKIYDCLRQKVAKIDFEITTRTAATEYHGEKFFWLMR